MELIGCCKWSVLVKDNMDCIFKNVLYSLKEVSNCLIFDLRIRRMDFKSWVLLK